MTCYFGYGSNLNAQDLYESKKIRLARVDLAILPHYRLAFTYRSNSRNGGALSVEPAQDQAVVGVLFEIPDAETQAIIDHKEGHPDCYERVSVTVQVNGSPVEACTYITNKARWARFVAPHTAYVEIVEQGYRAHGLDLAPLRAAAEGSETGNLVDGVFVYGTLLAGECRGEVLDAAGPRVEATTQGRLVDVGAFPGLVDGEGTVIGEYVPVVDIEQTLRTLDEIEGFHGYAESDGSLYHRVLALVTTPGGTRPAWTYRYARDTRAMEEIPGGSWRGWRAQRGGPSL